MNRHLILASSSPRRQYLMKEAGFDFTIEKPSIEETFPDDLPVDKVARYLAELKAECFRARTQDEIIVTADTVVILGNRILNKPGSRDEAIAMLVSLAGKTHRVMTGVSILSKELQETFDDTTEVTFEPLSRKDIELYVDTFKPYDKAGAYGAQDCLPSGMNPCSREELEFLDAIGKQHIVKDTITANASNVRVVVIRKLAGSYFNVMGLPVHKVYEHLRRWMQ